MTKNAAACIQSPRFLECCQTSLHSFLSLPRLAVYSEVQIFQAVIKWAEFKNDGEKLNPDISDSLLGPCMNTIRFLALSPSEFSSNVVNSGLLSNEDCLKILVYLNGARNVLELPVGICQISDPRLKVAPQMAQASNEIPIQPLMKFEMPGIEEVNEEEWGSDPFKPQAEAMPFKKNMICYRGAHPGLKFVSELQSPASFDMVFSINRDIFLAGITFTTQCNDDADFYDHYTESVHVIVRKVGEKQNVAYQSFSGVVKYDSVVDVMFKNPGKLQGGENYTINFILKSLGNYRCPARSCAVFCSDFIAEFSSYESSPYSGIIQSLILKEKL
jgi:hypothetical protein